MPPRRSTTRRRRKLKNQRRAAHSPSVLPNVSRPPCRHTHVLPGWMDMGVAALNGTPSQPEWVAAIVSCPCLLCLCRFVHLLREVVARAVWRGQAAEDLAAAYGVSPECAWAGRLPPSWASQAHSHGGLEGMAEADATFSALPSRPRPGIRSATALADPGTSRGQR